MFPFLRLDRLTLQVNFDQLFQVLNYLLHLEDSFVQVQYSTPQKYSLLFPESNFLFHVQNLSSF